MPGSLPPCGVYRTTMEIGGIPAGRFVYFHNHGDPGPGLYLPEAWDANRARFGQRGTPLPEPLALSAASLQPLLAEGFYRVVKPFFCCEKRCRQFEADLLVQLGYNGAAEPILFVPEIETTGMAVPTTGSPVSQEALTSLALLKVARRQTPADVARAPGGLLH